MVKIGQAGSNEWYGVYGGEAGDQRRSKTDENGCFDGELSIKPWYDKHWTHHFRAKNKEMAEAFANAIERICLNTNVGYDQNQDETLWEECDKIGWDIEKINRIMPCECDCCRLVDVGLKFAGNNGVGMKSWFTGNFAEKIMLMGGFNMSQDKSLLTSDKYLRRGDILLQEHHHVVAVLSDGECSFPTEDFDNMVMITNCASAYIRSFPTASSLQKGVVHGGDIVGHLSTQDKWAEINSNGIIGFVSPKYYSEMMKAKVSGCKSCHIRSGAGTSYSSVFVCDGGDVVFLLGDIKTIGGTTWYHVYCKDHVGWMSGKYCKPIC